MVDIGPSHVNIDTVESDIFSMNTMEMYAKLLSYISCICLTFE